MEYLKNNKWLWIVFPLVILFWLLKDVILGLLISGGNSKVEDAKEKDKELKDRADANNAEANQLVEEVKKSTEERKNDSNEDEDWNKK